MTTTQASNAPISAVVLDASVAVSIVSKEPNAAAVRLELSTLVSQGATAYAPSTIVSEVLYALCRKLESGLMTPASHAQAIADFQVLLSALRPSPSGDFALMTRAEAIRVDYSCRRSADGLYIALAEELCQTAPTVLLTIDKELPKQAAKNTPTVVLNSYSGKTSA